MKKIPIILLSVMVNLLFSSVIIAEDFDQLEQELATISTPEEDAILNLDDISEAMRPTAREQIGNSLGNTELNFFKNNQDPEQSLGISVETLQANSLAIYNSAKITVLNKVTAQTTDLVMNTGQKEFIGNISVKMHQCLHSNDLFNPYELMLVTVQQHQLEEDDQIIFQGWLLSSSLSAANIEHPVYEIIPMHCEKNSSTGK